MAIVNQQSKVSAHVAAFSRIKQSQYGDGQYQSVKFVSMDGKVEHWAAFSPEEAKQFSRDQYVNLVPTERRGKPTWDIEPLEAPTEPQPSRPLGFRAAPEPSYAAPVSFQQPAQQPGPVAQAGPDKAAIAQWITGQAKLYAFCQSQAIAALPDGVSEAAIQGAASTLYISTCRKFRLES
jgi:hypothetical protein